MSAAGFAWLGYAVTRLVQDPRAAREWGFRRDTLPQATLAAAVILAAGGIALWIIGAARGMFALTPHLLACLATYPLWGIAQEWLILAMIVRNLERWIPSRAPLIATGALLFASLHVPDPLLVVATLLLGLVFVPLYLRWRNVIPLGITHGWLGALAYFWLLGRDPWIEVFGGG